MAEAERLSEKQRALRARSKVTRRWAGLFLAILMLLSLLLFPLGAGAEGFRIAMSLIAILAVWTHIVIRNREQTVGVKPVKRRLRNQVAVFLVVFIPAMLFLFWPR